MSKRVPSLTLSCVLLAAALLVPGTTSADAAASQAAFEGANTSFRNGDYDAALAGYNEAIANGRVDARVFYNKGLAHYHLDQYAAARQAFERAAQDERMAALAYYQLGVLANRDGDRRSAERWFRRSRAEAESPRLRQLSTSALETIGVRQPYFEARFSAGFGYDSNAYRSPDSPYTDYSLEPPVDVDPVEQSGSYVPVRIRAAYFNPLSDRSTLVAAYRHWGDYYTDSELGNADETDHRLTLGVEHALGDGQSSSREFSYAAFIRSHGETNFDRDDGLERFDDGVSIADRFDYTGVGMEAEYKNRFGRVRYEIDASYSIRDYDDVATASSYDLSDYWLHGAIKIPLARSTRLEVGYEYRVRDFDDRRARDANGDSSSANPTLEYQYGIFDLGVRHRMSDSLVVELIYSRTNRDDQFVGYNDYTKDKVSFEATFEFSENFAAQLEVDYRDQQYDNAYAFNNPSQPSKEYQELQFGVSALYRVTDQLSLRADVEQEDVDSSDQRGAYDRLRASLSVSWEF